MRTVLSQLVVPALAGLLLATSGCGGGAGAGDGTALEGTEWTLVAGVEAPPDAVPTVTFADGTVSGSSGCNWYGGDYELEGDAIAISEIAVTAMGCPDQEIETEESYLAAFLEVDGWSLEDGELVLSAAGDEVLRYKPTAGP
jgi:heat shock protein HslJ